MLPRPPAPKDELCDNAYEFDDMSGDADSSPYPGSFELSAIDIALKKNIMEFSTFQGVNADPIRLVGTGV